MRRIIGDILIGLVILFTAYLSVIMTHRIGAVALKDSYIKIFRYELIACALFLMLALDIRFGILTMMKPKALKAAGWAVRVIVILEAAAFLFFAGRIIIGSFARSEGPAKNAIVLGLALENGEPTDDLLSRLDTAEKYARENPEAVLILTGGNPDESGRTEAGVMHDLLAGRGMAEDRMILEDKAETTKENFRNTAKLVDPAEPIVLISSDYHMDRAVRTAESTGFTRVLRLPAPSSFGSFGVNVMWEVILELNELTLKQ